MPANERQVGGAHYGGGDYQHWDWVCDTRMHYLPATASKYVARWRNKHGMQDIEKAIHYVEKAKEVGVTGAIQTHRARAYWRFVLSNNLDIVDAMICWHIMEGDWEAADEALQKLAASLVNP